jgi:hypothetical protein
MASSFFSPSANAEDGLENEKEEERSFFQTEQEENSSVPETQVSSEDLDSHFEVVIKNRSIKMTKATCMRAGREGVPKAPSLQAAIRAKEKVNNYQHEFEQAGRTLLTRIDYVPKQGRGTAYRANSRYSTSSSASNLSSKITHLQTLKSRTVDSFNLEPGYLLCDRTAEPQYDRLIEYALRANAGAQAVTQRRATQGASNQTPRINSRAVGMAAAAQCINASIAISLSEMKLRQRGIKTCNVLGSTSINPCKLVFASEEQRSQLLEDSSVFLPLISTTELVYNSIPTKLGTSSIRNAAQDIARRELTENLVSRAMYADDMLTSICRSIGGGYEIDSIWASVVLIVFLSYDPRGRRILSQCKLTDVDLQIAYVLESYGRAEITRRIRMKNQQNAPKKKRKRKRKDDEEEEEEEEKQEEEQEEEEEGVTDQATSGNRMDAPADALSSLLQDNEEEDSKTLGTKRRRASKSVGSSSTSDSYSLLNWWFRALRSKQVSVLETLIASSRDTAKQAAKSSLQRQAGDNALLASNKTLNGICMSTAVKSCEELVRLVHQPAKNIPMIVAIKTKWSSDVHIGVNSIPTKTYQNALHACKMLSSDLQPSFDAKTLILHSSSVQEFVAKTESGNMPGVMERYTRMAEIRSTDSCKSARGKRILSSIESFIQKETSRPIISIYGGVARSFISMKLSVPITESMNASAERMCEEGVEVYQRALNDNPVSDILGRSCSIINGRSNADYVRPPVVALKTSQSEKHRLEPVCSPCSRLAIGLRLNELLRRWMIGRTRKNGIAFVVCGLGSTDEIPKDLGFIMDNEPIPMAIITNVTTYADEQETKIDEDKLRSQKYSDFATISASLNICVDSAVRVPELVSKTTDLFQRRALMIVASSQASYVGDVGAALSAQWANCSSASSKKVSCADVNTLPLLSIWDCYAGGLVNVHRSYTNTAYSGTYGPHVCTGITPPGLLSNYYRSDQRKHGTMSLSQEAADKLCDIVTESHYVPVGDSNYAATPLQTRGIPHGFVPGLHTVLNDFEDAMGSMRTLMGREDDPTLDGVFCLPFSAFTQALAPDVESTVDLTIRHSFRDQSQCSVATGRSYLPDTTSENEAIFVEPMWRRPCQVCSSDNPFATSYGYADSMFNIANLMAIMVMDVATRSGIHDCADAQLDYFHKFVCRCVLVDDWDQESSTNSVSSAPSAPSPPSALWAVDFLVLLFSGMFPKTHAVNEQVVPAELSILSSKMATLCKKQQRLKKSPIGAPISKLVSEEHVNAIRERWKAFHNRAASICPWKQGLKPLLYKLMVHKGSNDVSKQTMLGLREAVDAIPRVAWLVYSKDGKTPPAHPNPLHECPSPMHVQRTHIDPIFCATGPNLEIDPRGCVVGLQPFQLRQLYILMLGSHLKNVKPQVVRNEGGLNLRISSAADLLEISGKERSEKAISPLQVEADTNAFGTRESKLYGCSLQRSAWDANALLIAPLLNRIEAPQSKEKRSMGEWGDASWLHMHLNEERETMHRIHDVEKNARNEIEHSALHSAQKFSWAM